MLLRSPSSASSRLAKGWLQDHHISFTERNMFAEPLSVEEVKVIMRMTENGVDDIISERSNIFQRLNLDVDGLSFQYLCQLISQHPGLLRLPIIFDDKRLQVGYQEEEMRKFLPKRVRSYRLQEMRKKEVLINQ